MVTRYEEEYAYPDDLPPEQRVPENAEITRIPYEVSDEELAEETERKAMENVEEMIDAISNLQDAKVFLKRLCKRLSKNGALP